MDRGDDCVESVQPRIRVEAVTQGAALTAVTTAGRKARGRLRDPIEDILEERGSRRRVLAAVPTLTAALHFARQNDILVAVPEHMSRPVLNQAGLGVRPLPLDLPPVPLVLAWHQRYDGDRAHIRLHEVVRTALRAVWRPAEADSVSPSNPTGARPA